jgi:hypothetical protein
MQRAGREKDGGIPVFSATMLSWRAVIIFVASASQESKIGTSTNKEASSVSTADQVASDVDGAKCTAPQVLTFSRLSRS